MGNKGKSGNPFESGHGGGYAIGGGIGMGGMFQVQFLLIILIISIAIEIIMKKPLKSAYGKGQIIYPRYNSKVEKK